MKKMIIHDGDALFEDRMRRALNGAENYIIIGENAPIQPCIGCFGCWVKTPTQCLIHDGYHKTQDFYKECDEVIIISENYYGMYSPFVKNVMDRAIGYMQPFFTKRNKEMHHKMRHDNKLNIQVHYYGEVTGAEKKTARMIAERNAINFNSEVIAVKFWNSLSEVKILV